MTLILRLPPESAYHFSQLQHWTTLPRTSGAYEGSWTFEEKPMEEQYIFCFYWTLGVMRTMPSEVTPAPKSHERSIKMH